MVPYLLAVPLILGQSLAVLLSNPSGKYHVGTSQHILNKTTENDVLSPDGTGEIILVTLFYPTQQNPKKAKILPYADPITNGLFERLWGYPDGSLSSLETKLQINAPYLRNEKEIKKPTLIFGPGGGSPQVSMYAALLGEIASYGYTIIGIDHPGEAPYLPLPNGDGIYGLEIDLAWDLELAYAVHAIRESDALAIPALFPPLVDSLDAPFNKTHFALFGHSLGGSSSVTTPSRSDTFIGGIDLDGSIFDTEPANAQKPILILGNELHTKANDPALEEFLALQTGWVRHTIINGSGHLDFSDIPLWLDVLGLRDPPVTTTPRVGTIAGERILEILSAYSREFFDLLVGKKAPLLEKPSRKYPEVTFDGP